MIRDLLAYEPVGHGTDLKLALDTINQILRRRSIIFLVSDFLADPESYRQALYMANRKHDVVAVDLHDPLETEIADVGVVALEDAESGRLVWVDTSSRTWREAFARRVSAQEAAKNQVLTNAGVDRVNVNTDQDYIAALTRFFQQRAQRLRR
jgi:uncharacterized protein (DUF58 family)